MGRNMRLMVLSFESLERFEKLSVLFLGMNPIEGEEKQFAEDNIERDLVKQLLKSYKEWKKNN